MDTDELNRLSGEEVGAIVAQWAERHPISMPELAIKLGVDSDEIESLHRQAMGRLSMSKWLGKAKSKQTNRLVISKNIFILVGIGMVIGAFGFDLIHSQLFNRFVHDSPDDGPPPRVLPVAVVANRMGGGPVGGPGRPNGSGISGAGGPMVTGEQSAAQQAGLSIGSTLATMASGSPPPPIAAMKFRPRAGLATPSVPPVVGGQPLPPYDVTKQIRSRQVNIPDDCVIRASTKTLDYIIRGHVTQNVQAADRMTDEDIRLPLANLIDFAMSRQPIPSEIGRPPTVESVDITISIGLAQSSGTISWPLEARNRTTARFLNGRSNETDTLTRPIVNQIRKLGLRLFSGQNPGNQLQLDQAGGPPGSGR